MRIVRDIVPLDIHTELYSNKAGYTATQVAYGLAGAVFEVTRAFWKEQ